MLISIAVLLMSGLILGTISKKIKFPSLFGMIIAGILVGPSVLNLLDASLLDISSEIRRMALIIILIRAGLKLSVDDLKRVGRPALLMCFIPASLEVIGMVLIAPKILEISVLDAAILGAVVGAVSPAVIVPRMIKLIDEGYGKDKSIPQMILAGASVDDVYVIVLFTSFLGLSKGESISAMRFVNIPLSIVTGIVVGLIAGYILEKIFMAFSMRAIIKVLVVLSVCFSLTYVEDCFGEKVPFAAYIAVMSLGLMIRRVKESEAVELSKIYDKLWIPAEIFLFVLVGASVEISSALKSGVGAIIVVLGALVFRMIGVYICMLRTPLNAKERLFCMLAYTPKATVQAAIGGIPLALGLGCGQVVLTVSVIAILITAPLGAFAIDATYKKWLKKA